MANEEYPHIKKPWIPFVKIHRLMQSSAYTWNPSSLLPLTRSDEMIHSQLRVQQIVRGPPRAGFLR